MTSPPSSPNTRATNVFPLPTPPAIPMMGLPANMVLRQPSRGTFLAQQLVREHHLESVKLRADQIGEVRSIQCQQRVCRCQCGEQNRSILCCAKDSRTIKRY